MKAFNKYFYFLFLLICCFISLPAFSQELSYVHYDEKDGPGGNIIYDMSFDKDGFLWLATENGAARFDGKNFTHITVEDGLYDNEIMRIYGDKKGRVWIIPLGRHLCYFLDGKVHTIYNDSLLKKINFERSVLQICEDNEGNLIFSDFSRFIELTTDNHLIDVSKQLRSFNIVPTNCGVDRYTNSFIIITKDKVYLYSHNKVRYYREAVKNWTPNKAFMKSYPNGDLAIVTAPAPVYNLNFPDSVCSFVSTTDGAWEVDTVTLRLTNHFLPGIRITQTLRDPENNLWFSTWGKGLYKLASKYIKTYHRSGKECTNSEVYTIIADKDHIYAGCNPGNALVVSKKNDSSGAKEIILSALQHRENRVFTSFITTDSSFVFGMDRRLVIKKNGKTREADIWPVKAIQEENKDMIFVGTSKYVFRVRISDLTIADTVWTGRCSSLLYSGADLYIGTFEGLYKLTPARQLSFLGNRSPLLMNRINDIKKSSDGIIWVGTNGKGIAALKNDTLTGILNEENGLSGNICKTLFTGSGYLWAGTNKGINKIIPSGNGNFHIIKYTTSDGLPSDLINSIYIEDSIIWAGTKEGITRINEKDISSYSFCRLKIFSLTAADKDLRGGNIALAHNENDISCTFTAVSYKSAGLITYYYRLKGYSDEWKTTTDNEINWKKLPPGRYLLELYAVNKFDIKSNILISSFIINAPFWQKTWFIAACVISFLLLLMFIIFLFNRRSLKKLQRKADLEHQFLSLEQQALQARMNPHFIFNCLNSIQQHILTNDKERANKSLTDFASFVRKTLDYSEKKNIRLSEECEYLEEYLEMEKMRFGDVFSYYIQIDDSVEAAFIDIPAFLLQPFVENSINHGLRHLQDKRGILNIVFTTEKKLLICTIRDNGVGRVASAGSSAMKGHVAKGTAIAAKRVELLRIMSNADISAVTNDLYDKNGIAAGTEVIIKLIY